MTQSKPNNSSQTMWIIEPHDPLIVRDGRPFNPTPGVRAYSQPFPPPSVVAGGIRTRAGMVNDQFDSTLIEQVKKIAIRGPLLVRLPDVLNYTITANDFFAPAPADAVLFESKADNALAIRKRLVPVQPILGAIHDLASDDSQPNIGLVGFKKPDPDLGKPLKNPPRFWTWKAFTAWLLADVGVTLTEEVLLHELGIPGLPLDQRSHVSIEPENQTASDGMLFQTRGLEFTHVSATEPPQWTKLASAKRLALAVDADYHEASELPKQKTTKLVAPLGGERRLAHWEQVKVTFPLMPNGLEKKISETKACRIVLLTPALWQAGFRPTDASWLLQPYGGVTATLNAIAINRAQVISGWDFQLRKPKKTRRLAPAGTVLFVTLEGNADDIKQWVGKLWMNCISDDDQDSRDGFGLAVLGTWDGQTVGT